MKIFTVRFSPIVIEDVQQAVDYYEELQQGLGNRFVSNLLLKLNSIKRNPHFASVRYDEYIRW